MDVIEARELFPATAGQVYMNHAATSPFAVPVRDAMVRAVERFSAGSVRPGSGLVDLRDSVVERTARLLGGAAERVTVVRNTTHGILLAANGLEWARGDNVVCANVEFPANVYPWLNLERKGVEVRFAKERDGRIAVGDIESLMNERTRVVALSFVEFTNGFRNDVRAIGELCRQSGAFFVVDAIQGLGALALDAGEAKIDLVAAGAHKWLGGPMGIGIAHLSERIWERVYPPEVGWLGVAHPEDFLNYDLTFAPDGRRFEGGCPNIVGLHGLDAALGLILDIGIEAIERRVFELTNRLVEQLTRLECAIASPRQEGEWSGIVSFAPPDGETKRLWRVLTSHGIITSQRNGWVRVSCHYWNNEEDVAAVADAVADWIKREGRS